MLRELDPGNFVNIYRFCYKVSRVVTGARAGDADKIAKAVSDIKLSSGTDIHRVLEFMYSDSPSLNTEGVGEKLSNVKIILITDGNLAVGVRDEGRILNVAEKLDKYIYPYLW